MGALAGVMEAQYNELRKHGHSPSEAFNETVEELTQSLIRLVAQERHGLDVRQLQHHRAARRAGLAARVPPGRRAGLTTRLYQSVVSGEQTRIVLAANSAPDYKQKLEVELREMRESEMWQTGAAVRSLRPENWNK